MFGEVTMSRVVLKGPERRSGRPKKDRNGVPLRSGPIRTLLLDIATAFVNEYNASYMSCALNMYRLEILVRVFLNKEQPYASVVTAILQNEYDVLCS